MLLPVRLARTTTRAGPLRRTMALCASDYGVTLPTSPDTSNPNPPGFRQQVLLDTLSAFEERGAHYHAVAAGNLARWRRSVTPPPPVDDDEIRTQMKQDDGMSCEIRVIRGDWGVVTHALTREFGEIFTALNMANAYGPGGGYTFGHAAQEENMFRRSDAHFSLERSQMDQRTERYTPAMSSLINCENGRCYLDTEKPRVCFRGPEELSSKDPYADSYRFLADEEIFPFFELRAAAVDLRDSSLRYDVRETQRRVSAILDTCSERGLRHLVLGAFGCGAFRNPTAEVAEVFRKELEARSNLFEVVGFAIFDAGYGPENYTPFAQAFERS